MFVNTLPGSNGSRPILIPTKRPIYSLVLGTKIMIVLSSDEVIKDLLDKRSGIYSSRPDIYLGNVVSGWLRVVLMVGR